jgi:DNA-binding phage protein
MTSEEPLPDRCGAKCRDGGCCTQYPVDGSERCRMHGGTQPKGMDSPNAVHGLRSDYFSEEDREIYEEVRQHDNAELIQEEIWAIKTKLLRAAREAGGNGAESLVRDMLEDVTAVHEDTIAALAKTLQVSEEAIDRALGRLNDLVKTYHKITEGETHHHEHSGGGGGAIEFDVTRTVVSENEHDSSG